MEIKYDVHYGFDKPDEVIYAPDMVYVNIGLHRVDIKIDEEDSHDWVATEMKCYTYQEFVKIQDSVIESQKSINKEQDELIAELIEGM